MAISVASAAQLAGLRLLRFLDILVSLRIPVVNSTAADFGDELSQAERWLGQITRTSGIRLTTTLPIQRKHCWVKGLVSSMAPHTNPNLQQRLQQLMREVEDSTASPRSQAPGRNQPKSRLLPRIPMLAGVGIALALLIGIQLGALPWRYRREMWQAQGAVFGVVVGLTIGRLSAKRSAGGE